MHDHPEGEEELAEQRAPGLVAVVDGVGDPGHHAHQVEDQNCSGRDEQRRPLERVELPELCVVAGLGRDSEVGVDPREHLEQALEERKEMRRDPANHPKLLVAPPLVHSHSRPPHLQNARGEDGDEERDEKQTVEVANLHTSKTTLQTPSNQHSRLLENATTDEPQSQETMLTVGMMNLPVSKQTAGSTQYATRGREVSG